MLAEIFMTDFQSAYKVLLRQKKKKKKKKIRQLNDGPLKTLRNFDGSYKI